MNGGERVVKVQKNICFGQSVVGSRQPSRGGRRGVREGYDGGVGLPAIDLQSPSSAIDFRLSRICV